MIVYSESDIEGIKAACDIAAKCMSAAADACNVGSTTLDIENAVTKILHLYEAKSSCLNFLGFPGIICTSVNHVVAHGVPSKDVILKDGDIISIDICVNKGGFHGDMCRTFPIGNISEASSRLLEVSKLAVEYAYLSLFFNKPHTAVIGAAIEDYVTDRGLKVFGELVGHGVGKSLHEKPYIPPVRLAQHSKLPEGTVFTIEPVVTTAADYLITPDGIVTSDDSWTAQHEDTFAIINGKPEILTIY